MRKLNTTESQRRCLRHLRRNGKSRLTELPNVGSKTLTTLAEHGLVSVFVKITQKGQETIQRDCETDK